MIQGSSKTATLLLALPLLTASLAGCLSDDDSDLEWSSYEEAKAASGPTFSPVEEDSPVRVKWLEPSTPDSVPQSQSAVWMLVYDSEADEPVTDAEISLGSWMPAMGHGTSAEEDPTHQDFGVYRGVINPTMGGAWQLNLTVTLTSDGAHDFQMNYTVEGEGGMDGGHDDGHDHGNDSTNETDGPDGNMTDGPDDGNRTGNQTANETQPEGFAGTFTDSFSATVDYARDWTFPTNSTNFTVAATINMTGTLPTDEVTLTLFDAEGDEQGSASTNGEATTVEIADPPNTGEYTANVTGQAADASYTLNVTVE